MALLSPPQQSITQHVHPILQTPHDVCGEQNDRFDQFQSSLDCDSRHTKWQQEQPDKRIQDESSKRQRPAENEKDEPQKKFCHWILPL